MWRCKSVPRTNFLTYITPKDPIIPRAFHGLWQLIFEFDGKIRNTLAPVDHIGRHDCLGGTCIDASRTRTTVIGSGRIVIQFKIDDEFGYKIVRACFLGNKIGIFTDPTESAFGCPSFVQDWRRIDKSTSVNGTDFGLYTVQ